MLNMLSGTEKANTGDQLWSLLLPVLLSNAQTHKGTKSATVDSSNPPSKNKKLVMAGPRQIKGGDRLDYDYESQQPRILLLLTK